MPYNAPVTFTTTGNYGCGPDDEDDVYTVAEFRANCESGAFIDYDGYGHPVREHMCDEAIVIKPSRLHDIPKDATHIVWFNR